MDDSQQTDPNDPIKLYDTLAESTKAHFARYRRRFLLNGTLLVVTNETW